jgi:hypothetical protein
MQYGRSTAARLCALLAVATATTARAQYAWWNTVDLNPHATASSEAHGISGTQIAGSYSSSFTYNKANALLWDATIASQQSLHPYGFETSFARAVSATRQVGEGILTGGTETHALLWNGTAEHFVDLHPSGFSNTYATGIRADPRV